MCWVGSMFVSLGVSSWVAAFALEFQIASGVGFFRHSSESQEIASLNVEWVRNVAWFSPYILALGVTVAVAGTLIQLFKCNRRDASGS